MYSHLKNILEILALAENLKFELRHSFTSNGRQESVAEHIWRVSLMAVLLQPILNCSFNMEKLLKMIIIHDLVEAEAKDVSALDVIRNPELKLKKHQKELNAINNIKNKLISTNGQEIYDLFIEFESKNTIEAKIANALDKLEAQLQHNHAAFETWENLEYEMTYMLDKHVSFNKTLTELKELIVDEASEKMQINGVDTAEIIKKVQ